MDRPRVRSVALRGVVAPFTAPDVVGALVLLVVNDRLLKAWWPGLVTGKLSDLVGLYLFPLVLVALAEIAWAMAGRLPPRRSRSLIVAGALTAAVFTAIKVDRTAGDVYREVFGLLRWPLSATESWFAGDGFGASTRVELVADRSDLVALPAVAAVWWIHGSGPERRARRRPSRRADVGVDAGTVPRAADQRRSVPDVRTSAPDVGAAGAQWCVDGSSPTAVARRERTSAVIKGGRRAVLLMVAVLVGAGCGQADVGDVGAGGPPSTASPSTAPTSVAMGGIDTTYTGSGPKVVVLGDSITVSATEPLRTALDGRAVKIGAYWGEGLSDGPFSQRYGTGGAREYAATYGADAPAVAVVALGTNDAWNPDLSLDAALAALDDVVAALQPACIVTVTIPDDGIHLTASGRLIWATLVAGGVEECLAAG